MIKKPYRSSQLDFREYLASSRLLESSVLGGDIVRIWDRSRDMQRNSSLVNMIERRIVDHACSKPLTPKCPSNPLAEDFFWRWSKTAGIDGVSSLDELYAQIVATQVHRDVLLLMVQDQDVAEGQVKSRIQLIDGSRVRTPTNFAKDSNGITRDLFGRKVVLGVSYSESGKEAGWWIANPEGGWDDSSRNYRYVDRIGRTGIWNGALMRRARSARPDMARTLPLYQSCVDDILDIEELKTAGVGASFSKNLLSVLLETNNPGGIKQAMNSLDDGEGRGPDDYKFVGEIEDRSVITIPGGTKPHIVASSGSTDTLAMLMGSLAIVSGSCGVPRPILLQDMAGMNFSTSKMAYELFYKLIGSWNRCNADVMTSVWNRVLDEATFRGMSGLLPSESDVEWIGTNAIPETDPDKNATAIGKKISLGLTTPSRELAKLGEYYEDVVAARAEEELILRKVSEETGVGLNELRSLVFAGPWTSKSGPMPEEEPIEEEQE
jgi:hypothetical protein